MRPRKLSRKASLLAAGVVAGLLLTAGVAVAGSRHSGNEGDEDGGVTGAQASQARDAALRATSGGTANAVERDSENGATWEVEVTKTDGSTVDVRLDADYRVVVIESDSE